MGSKDSLRSSRQAEGLRPEPGSQDGAAKHFEQESHNLSRA